MLNFFVRFKKHMWKQKVSAGPNCMYAFLRENFELVTDFTLMASRFFFWKWHLPAYVQKDQ